MTYAAETRLAADDNPLAASRAARTTSLSPDWNILIVGDRDFAFGIDVTDH